MAVKTIEWRDDTVRMIDQRLLPEREVIRVYHDWRGVAEAIRTMVIRGAPAIGVAAAMGVALGMRGYQWSARPQRALPKWQKRCARRGPPRLTWRGRSIGWAGWWTQPRARRGACFPPPARRGDAIYEEDFAANRSLGRFGATLLATRRPCYALQCRRARHGGLRHGARRGARRARGGQEDRGHRRRDPAVSAGRAADRVGIAQGPHPGYGYRRQHGGERAPRAAA